MFGVLRRDGDARDMRWFTAPNGFQGHTLNAFDDGDRIYIDMPVTNGNIFYFFPQADGTVPPPESLASNLKRWTFDMRAEGNSLTSADLNHFPCEFPRADDRYLGKPYRHGWLMGLDMTRSYDFERLGPPPFQFFNQLVHIDVSTGKTLAWWAGPAECFQEPVFVPKSADAPEGHGWVIALLNHLQSSTTDLVVLDALAMEDGPVATIHLPVRLRMSLHGSWVGKP
jgi:carotenoid cleavage dioxygenase